MTGASQAETAIQRLTAALAALENALDHRAERDAKQGDLQAELHRLGGDRSRLAQSLDDSEARAARLEEANRDVSRRLVSAMESIRSVLERPGG